MKKLLTLVLSLILALGACLGLTACGGTTEDTLYVYTEAGFPPYEYTKDGKIVGVDIDKNAIQRIECGKRFVTDIELKSFAEIFGVTLDELV